MTKHKLLEGIENYVSNLFLEANTSGLFYHDFNHTLSIVEAVTHIADVLLLPQENKNILIVSAWLHDVGYLYTRIEHEAFSIKIAKQALRPNYEQLVTPVTTCIAATKVGEKPQSQLAALLKDADTAFGSAYKFIKTSNTYRKELHISENKIFDEETWQQMCLTFLENVSFYSNYGKEHFAPLVIQNLESYRLSVKNKH